VARIDQAAASAAIRAHLRALGPNVEHKDVRWVPDLVAGLQLASFGTPCKLWQGAFAPFNALPIPSGPTRSDMQVYRICEQHVSDVRNWEQPQFSSSYDSMRQHDAVRAKLGASRPMTLLFDAIDAGLWAFWPLPSLFIAVPRPELHLDNDRRPHRDGGPALRWNSKTTFWFWHGVMVTQQIAERPETITVADIDAEQNVAVRRIMVERYGAGRFIADSGAEEVHRDKCGVLLRRRLPGDWEPLCVVKVVNSTPEPDGSYVTYWLRVPPGMRTAREAVAWTFGLAPEDYKPRVQT
jgi:hypothetical protein